MLQERRLCVINVHTKYYNHRKICKILHSSIQFNHICFRKPDPKVKETEVTEEKEVRILKLGNHGDKLKLNNVSKDEFTSAFLNQLRSKGSRY